MAHEPRRHAAQLADAVAGEGQRLAVARERERQLPGAAGLQQPRRRLRAVRIPPAVQQHHQLRLGAAVRRGRHWGRQRRRCSTRSSAAGSSPGSTASTPASRSRCTYTPGATFLVSGIAQDFRGANNYRPNVTCDPFAHGSAQTINNWFNRACVTRADRSEPAVRQRGAQHRPRPELLAARPRRRRRRFALGGPAHFEFRLEAFNLLNRTNFRAPNGNRSAGAFGTITRPSIRVSFSSGSSSCGSPRSRC